MSKKKKFFEFTEIESTGQDNAHQASANQNHHQYHGQQPVDPSILSYLTEGYALYAAAFYPPLLHATAVRNRDINLFRQAANEAHRNTDEEVEGEGSSLIPMASSDVESDQRDFILMRLARRCVNLLLGPIRFIQREREISRSIRTLSSLDDRGLRDIGLSRADIDHMVRYGRDR